MKKKEQGEQDAYTKPTYIIHVYAFPPHKLVFIGRLYGENVPASHILQTIYMHTHVFTAKKPWYEKETEKETK